MTDNRGIQTINEGGDPTLVAAHVLFSDPARFARWKIRGGPPDVLDKLQKIGFQIFTDSAADEPAPCFLRPRIAHVWPCPMTVAGAQRFVLDLAIWQSRWADVTVIFRGDGPAGWVNYLPKDHSISFIQVADEKGAERALAEIRPALCWHHSPHFRFALDACHKSARHVIGTEHGFGGNTDPGRPSYVIPIIGDGAIHHGIDTTVYGPRENARGRYSKSPFRVGIIGRRTSEKLPATFVAALVEFAKTHPKIEWTLAGNSYQNEDTARSTAALTDVPRIRLIGNIDPADMPTFMRSEIDAVCIPSTTECCPYTAIEAMASGLPVVARAVGGLPEVIGDAGVLCRDDAEIFAAVLDLAVDRKRSRSIGRTARVRAESNFDIGRMVREYSARIEDMTGGDVREPDGYYAASIVIPVFNTPVPWLMESVESVMTQMADFSERDGHAFEIVLVDDGSDDADTVAALDTLAMNPGVNLVRRAVRGGVGAALNDGIRAAQSEIIIRHDADDVMIAGRVLTQVAAMRANPDVALIAGQMTMVDGSPIATTTLRDAQIWDQPHAINHPTVAVRREAVLSVGGYPVFDHGPEDFGLWCRMGAGGAKFAVVPDVFTAYRGHEGQESRHPDINKKAEQIRREWRQWAAR